MKYIKIIIQLVCTMKIITYYVIVLLSIYRGREMNSMTKVLKQQPSV